MNPKKVTYKLGDGERGHKKYHNFLSIYYFLDTVVGT